MPKLNQDYVCIPFEHAYPNDAVTIPAGTELVLIKDADGLKGDLYAVKSVELLIKLTGNTHDPHIRYVFVPSDHVELP